MVVYQELPLVQSQARKRDGLTLGNDLDLVVILPNTRITIKEALAKGLLEPPPHGNTGKKHTPEHSAKISEALSGKKKPPGFGEAMSKARKGKEHPWARGEKSPTKRPEVREKISKALTGKKKLPEHCTNISKARIELWKDPKFAKSVSEAWRKKPNLLEKEFDELLQSICPGEFEYAGNRKFVIGRKHPDFLNVNGKKKIIEIYGDYWHNKSDEKERIDFFKQYGYDCLVIWDYEIEEDLAEVTRKVLLFIGRNERSG